jgi:hypothetical protein
MNTRTGLLGYTLGHTNAVSCRPRPLPAQFRVRMLHGCLVCLTAFLAVSAAARDTLDISPAFVSSRLLNGPHEKAEYELPDGVQRHTPAADRYFTRWLQCSTMVEWCTPEEVQCGCTYEVPGTWSRGSYPWESGNNVTEWPPCQPSLPAVYAACSPPVKLAASCIVPRTAKVWNGNGTCVFHKVCGNGYCHEGLQSTPPDL